MTIYNVGHGESFVPISLGFPDRRRVNRAGGTVVVGNDICGALYAVRSVLSGLALLLFLYLAIFAKPL